MTFLVYTSTGVMIGSGYSDSKAAYNHVLCASKRHREEMYSVYMWDVGFDTPIFDRAYLAGQKVGGYERAKATGVV
jgi:hypothetical protein